MSSQSIINSNKTGKFSTGRSYKSTKRIKIKWNDNYKFVKKLVSSAQPLYNWRILKPKRLGYICINAWSNDGKEFNSDRCTWGYQDPNNLFIYIGNNINSWKLGLSHKYYNSKYPYQQDDTIFNYINELASPID